MKITLFMFMRNIVSNCFVNVAQQKSSAVNHLWTNQVVLASMEYEYLIYLNPFQHIYIAILQSSKPITKKAAVLASPVIRLYSNPKCWTILSSSPWVCCAVSSVLPSQPPPPWRYQAAGCWVLTHTRDPSSYPAQVHCVSRLTSRVRLGEATPELYVNFAVSIQSDFNEAVIRFPFLLTVIQTEADPGWHLSVAWMARITNYRGMNLISTWHL